VQIDDRQGHVPREYFKNPLHGLFEYFDADGDGLLTEDEIFEALRLKGIGISRKQLTKFVEAADINGDNKVDVTEFKMLVHQMAAIDRQIYGLLIE
jgi:Ca2+-binding EF-hand superfamily protein